MRHPHVPTVVGEKGPRRFRQRPGNMNDARINGNHQIKRLNNRGRVGKVVDMRRKIMKIHPRRRILGLGSRLPLLQ